MKLVSSRYSFAFNAIPHAFDDTGGRFDTQVRLNQYRFHVIPGVIVYLGIAQDLRDTTHE